MAALLSLTLFCPDLLILSSSLTHLEVLALAFIFKVTGSMVPGPPTCLIAPSSGRSSIPSLFLASCGVHSGEARNYSSTVITKQLWIFGLRLLLATPSLCTSFAQSSFVLHPNSSLFLSPTFEVETIPLLMLCPIFICSGSVNSPCRQIWKPLICLPQHRPSGRSPSLSPVSSHCPLNSPHLLCWNSLVCFLLSFKAMDPIPCIGVTATIKSASQPLNSIWLVFGLPTSKTALQTRLQMLPSIAYSYEASSGPLGSPLTAAYLSPCQSCDS